MKRQKIYSRNDTFIEIYDLQQLIRCEVTLNHYFNKGKKGFTFFQGLDLYQHFVNRLSMDLTIEYHKILCSLCLIITNKLLERTDYDHKPIVTRYPSIYYQLNTKISQNLLQALELHIICMDYTVLSKPCIIEIAHDFINTRVSSDNEREFFFQFLLLLHFTHFLVKYDMMELLEVLLIITNQAYKTENKTENNKYKEMILDLLKWFLIIKENEEVPSEFTKKFLIIIAVNSLRTFHCDRSQTYEIIFPSLKKFWFR